MRRTLLALAIATIPGLGAAAGLASSIGAVTVYQDRAVVTRSASSELTAGEHELVLENLPVSLQESSLQVSAKSTGQASLLDVKVRDAYQADTANERVRALQEQLRKLEAQQAELDDEAAVLENQRELVLMMQRGATEPAKEGARLTLDELKAIQTLSADSLGKTLASLRQVAERKTVLEREMEALHDQLNVLQGQLSRRTKTVTLRVNLARAGKVDLAVSYAVGGARWTPAYDARLRPADRSVDLGYFGVISQNTGEDWKNVKLTLSTARPSLGGGAPPLQPWIIDVAPPPPPPRTPRPVAAPAPVTSEMSMKRSRPSSAAEAYADAAMPEPAPEAVEVSTAQMQNEATSASFQIKNPATLPSDNSSQRVAIATAKLPATLQYQSTPALREAVFLTAQASNNTDFPFLAGPLNTFLDDAFVASSRIKAVMPGEKVELAMGADDGISIKRQLVNRFTESTGFSGSGKRVTYEYKITVKNNKATKEQLVFKDRLPVSRNEKIVVKLLSPADRDVKREEDGKLAWEWALEPGKSRETVLKFSVDYPGDVDVSGI
ncbi:mucoidy inhibitor MuiA family protein [Achromobacter marplatensis]|uniref:Mucoidy inhibitor MuiA family protein n=1 Tax=Achromobacter marplatensis TaxID=470868 RepID=A0AA42W7K6_9BURK|nr:mucoidy inhibitor MuiA family protein [Achromobacter marplatensis]MDH2050099.1 mucoidy inhibitor MuiA family protein [Achromobacter marplatensis]